MASPISNDPGLRIGGQTGQGARADGAASERPAAVQSETSNGAVSTGDTLTLSEAGRQMNSERADTQRGLQSPEEAQALVEKLKARIEANPGFASAVHNASAVSRLATLLDSYA